MTRTKSVPSLYLQRLEAFQMKSLHSFCKENGDLPKTSVPRWLLEQGFDTSVGLSDEAIAAATAQFVSAQTTHESPTELLLPGYIDPFSGVLPSSGMVPAGYYATDRSLAIAQAEQRVQQICLNNSANAQQTVQAALKSGNHFSMQLGAFLAERTIQSAEMKRRQMLEQYLQTQGVVTGGT